MWRVRGLSRISLSYNVLPLFSADASIYVSFSPSYLLGKEEAEEKIRTHWLCLPVHKIESDIQLRLQTATINSEKENSTKQIHSNKFVPIKNREGNAETTTGKTGCLDKYNTAYPVTNSKYLYHFSRKESGRFEHPDNYFYFCGLLKRIILKSNNEHVW